ncbi:MAG TPA: hypothetical protein VK961_27935 [Chthoniobacter sp.]|nr:hypothetical protein [Chthoniobacter sp.]
MRRFIQFCCVGIFSLLVVFVALRVYVNWATYSHAVSAEARVIGPDGLPAFVSVKNPLNEERVAIGYPVFRGCVESRAYWKGTLHDFPFPETPAKDDSPSHMTK